MLSFDMSETRIKCNVCRLEARLEPWGESMVEEVVDEADI